TTEIVVGAGEIQWRKIDAGSPPAGRFETMAGKKTIQNNGRTADGRFKKGHTNGFKPGQSGNPGGRPRNDTLTASLLAKLKELAPGADEKTVADCLATVLVREALQGSIHAISLIADRTEGKARQAIDV